MLALLPRSKLTKLTMLTVSQIHVIYAFRTISTPYRLFSVSSARGKDAKDTTESHTSALRKALDATDFSNPRRGQEIAAQDDQVNLTTRHAVTVELEKNRNGLFWENYYRFEVGKDVLLDAATRKETLRRLIRFANGQEEWDALEGIFKLWAKNQWGMEPVAETALYAQATEHTQISLLVYLIKERIIHPPSPRQARQVYHAIVANRRGSQQPLPDRLAQSLNFNYVNTDPRILSQRRSQSATDKSRSVTSTDDIVIGATMLSVLLQAAGEPTFDAWVRSRCAGEALKLSSSLKTWRQRGIDGSGVDAISLAQEEKGWAYIATVECLAALEVPSVLETLKRVWLENVEASSIRGDWVIRRRLGGGASKDWATHLRGMKKWIKEANSIFEER